MLPYIDHVAAHFRATSGARPRPHLTCADGFSLSIQGNQYAYCTPRHDGDEFDAVEVGFPSAAPELIGQYAEEPDRPTKTVYGYVPTLLVNQLIDLHGGPARVK